MGASPSQSVVPAYRPSDPTEAHAEVVSIFDRLSSELSREMERIEILIGGDSGREGLHRRGAHADLFYAPVSSALELSLRCTGSRCGWT